MSARNGNEVVPSATVGQLLGYERPYGHSLSEREKARAEVGILPRETVEENKRRHTLEIVGSVESRDSDDGYRGR